MSYAMRNTLALTVVLLLTVGGGGYWLFVHMAGELEALEVKTADRTAYFEELTIAITEYDSVRIRHIELADEWDRSPKVLPDTTSPSELYRYLNELRELDRGSAEIDFTYQREAVEEEYGYHSCMVVGKGSFRDLYNLVWRIEHEKPLVHISSLHVKERRVPTDDGRSKSELEFEMVLDAYYTKRELLPIHSGMAFEAVDPYVGHNPFFPLVREELPLNSDGLIEVESAIIEALTTERVIVRDAAGRRATLRPGDKVYLGRLREIRMKRRQAVFELNKGGIYQEVVLELGAGENDASRPSRGIGASSKRSVSRITDVDVTRIGAGTRVDISHDGEVLCRHRVLESPSRILLELEPAMDVWGTGRLYVDDPIVREVRSGQYKEQPPIVRLVVELAEPAQYDVTESPGRISVTVGARGSGE